MIALQTADALLLQAGGQLLEQGFVATQATASAGGRSRKKYYVEVEDQRWFVDTREQAIQILANIEEVLEDEYEEPTRIRIEQGRPAPIRVKTNAPRAKAATKRATKTVKRFIHNRLPQIKRQTQARRQKRQRDEQVLLLLM